MATAKKPAAKKPVAKKRRQRNQQRKKSSPFLEPFSKERGGYQ